MYDVAYVAGATIAAAGARTPAWTAARATTAKIYINKKRGLVIFQRGYIWMTYDALGEHFEIDWYICAYSELLWLKTEWRMMPIGALATRFIRSNIA